MSTQPISSTPEVHHLGRKPIEPIEPIEAEAIVVSQPPQLALQRAPEVVLEEAAKAASALRDVIERKPNKCVINGKTFLQFEDWQTLGRFYGITVAARETTYIEQGRARGYEANAEAILVSTGAVISSAQAMCLDDEQRWNDKPMFQLRSMAQTRAAAKALRNVLAWVVVMAGYAPTPAEEMNSLERTHQPMTAQASTGSKIPQPRVEELCRRISNARDMQDLFDQYSRAGNEAKRANDRAALAAFIQAKNVRKARLQQ